MECNHSFCVAEGPSDRARRAGDADVEEHACPTDISRCHRSIWYHHQIDRCICQRGEWIWQHREDSWGKQDGHSIFLSSKDVWWEAGLPILHVVLHIFGVAVADATLLGYHIHGLHVSVAIL